MDFLLIIKDKTKQKDFHKEYSSSFEVFEKRGQKENKVFNNDNFHLSIYNGLNSKCYYKEYPNGDFIITLGTLFYKDNFGNDCLDLLINDFRKGKRNLYNDLMGSFSVLIFTQRKLYTFNDFLGLMRIYFSRDNLFFSTSFLAIAKSLKTKSPSTQEIYEYIIRGGMYGDKTILKEINLIPRSTAVCINGECLNEKLEFTYKRLPFYNDFDKMVDYISNEYIKVFNIIARTFGNNITAALSGGYDTRLMLALLRKNDIIPKLYVYGNDNSSDVIIAKNIAEKEGFELEHINKDNQNKIKTCNYKNIVNNNFYLFDGLSTNGIFDNGMDVKTRKHRSFKRIVQLNGAGGEVWRNFWQLNSFEKRPIDFVRHKWDVFNYDAYSDKFNKAEYFDVFTKKLGKSINLSINNKKLSRKEMEMSYPLFRYRYWQSIGNSINLLFSHTLMPLMETRFLYPSFDLPIQFKYNGKFEAALINNIDSNLAKYTSNYGHNFVDNVSIKKKAWGFIIRNIPLTFKPYLRNKFSNKEEITPYFLNEKYIAEIINLNNMFILDYIDIRKIKDSRVLSRALSLEYFFNDIR